MGQEQSSTGSHGAQPAAAPQKTCYYELLGLSNLATDEEIRRAYKRKALELHPDRNINDVESATRRFAEVQTAYEILSDAHERAWYDSHRDAILRGDDSYDAEASGEPTTQYNVKLTTSDHLFSLIGKFAASTPMTDDPSIGFYGILSETFSHLSREEAAASQAENHEPKDYPPFGTSISPYRDVVRPFYQIWSSFYTRKSFAWKDKYRLSDAPDRRTRRLMEKDNTKFRADAVREFNDAVRSLVQFVKKRDKRYTVGAAAAGPGPKSEETMRKEALAQAARARAANREREEAKAAAYVVPDWVKSSYEDKDNNNGGSSTKDEYEGRFESEEESEVEEVIECVICDKIFKTEKAFESHEKSKKHVKNVQAMRRKMMKENKDLNLDKKEAQQQAKRSSQAPSMVTASEDEDGGDIPAVVSLADLAESQRENENEEEETRGLIFAENKKDAAQAEVEAEGEPSSEASDQGSDYAPPEASEGRLLDGNKKARPSSPSLKPTKDPILADISKGGVEEEFTTSTQDNSGTAVGKKLGKAKLKRQKKAARHAAEEVVLPQNKCGVCNNTFPSRTKLFKHLEESGHAELKTTKAKSKGKKKR
ncbi:hypothetical protein MKZ38_000753 [Zalerion maritima]|uniref:Uncharacterized protein n=1 Tax=Zalerion maritima TaxID=339359 RepID=A0AAD5WTI9_9PEZI|nr:hypothetical protein MKZ38_000753 [Zalerion maritima]